MMVERWEGEREASGRLWLVNSSDLQLPPPITASETWRLVASCLGLTSQASAVLSGTGKRERNCSHIFPSPKWRNDFTTAVRTAQSFPARTKNLSSANPSHLAFAFHPSQGCKSAVNETINCHSRLHRFGVLLLLLLAIRRENVKHAAFQVQRSFLTLETAVERYSSHLMVLKYHTGLHQLVALGSLQLCYQPSQAVLS